MMEKRLLEACAFELERMAKRRVVEQFEALCHETGEVEIPHIGGIYEPRKPHLWLVHRVTRALAARAWCELQGVSEPLLPLRVEEIEEMQVASCPALFWFGHYADHLRGADWNIRQCFTFDGFRRAYQRAGIEPS